MRKMIPWFGLPLDVREVRETLRIVSLAENISKFEGMFAKKMGMSYAFSMFSGRTALYLILKALDLNREEEVIVPTFVCPVVLDSILMAQVKPVLVDIDPFSYTMDIEAFNEAISPKTKAVIPVHTYGHPCDMDALCEISGDRGIYVIEDCAQAVGAEYNKRLVGSFGDVSFFSFNIDKPISLGWGGMILTDDRDIADSISTKLNLLEKCSWADGLWVRERFMIALLISKPLLYKIFKWAYGTTKRLVTLGRLRKRAIEEESDIPLKRMAPEAAGIGLIQLEKLDNMIEKRIANAKELSRHIENIEFLDLPRIRDNVKHAFLCYTVKVKGNSARENRDKIVRKLNDSGIGAGNFVWPSALHQIPRFRNLLKLQDEKFPVTEDFVDRFINLPVYPSLEKSDIKYISDSLSSSKL